jgi:hypothetical protein
MKRVGMLVLGFSVLVLGAACDDSPTAPSNQDIVFTAQLSAANEVPPVSNAESTGRGTATMTFHPTRDSGNAITGGTVDITFSLNSFPAGSNAILAHIHTGAVGVNGSPVVNTNLTAGTAIAMPAGTANFSVTGLSTDAATINGIVANPAGFYFNVHTTLNPGGAVRGQLVRQ